MKNINKKNILNILKSVGVLLLMIFWPTIIFTIFNVDLNTISDKNYVIYYTISSLTLNIILISIYRKDFIKDFKNYFKNFSKNFETSFKYWIIGLIIMYVSNFFITFILHKQIAGNEETVRNYLAALPLLMTFNAVICAPINEELVFRKSFKDIFPNKWIFATMSGLIFGSLHVTSYITTISDIIYIIPYASLGFAFGLLYYKTDNIFSSITVHSIHNLLATLLVLLGATI